VIYISFSYEYVTLFKRFKENFVLPTEKPICKIMESSEFEKSKVYVAREVIDYTPNSVVIKNILSRITGNVSIVSIDSGERTQEKISSFDTLIQVLDGKAEVVIDETSNFLEGGHFIIVPAHSSNFIHAREKFKMIITIIKSGYEEVA